MTARRSDRVLGFGLRLQYVLALLPFVLGAVVLVGVVALVIAL